MLGILRAPGSVVMPDCKRLPIVGPSVTFALVATAWTSAGCGALIGLDPGEPIGLDANPSETVVDDAGLDLPADRSTSDAGDEPMTTADAWREGSISAPPAAADAGVAAAHPETPDSAGAPVTMATTPPASTSTAPAPASTSTAPPPRSTSTAPPPATIPTLPPPPILSPPSIPTLSPPPGTSTAPAPSASTAPPAPSRPPSVPEAGVPEASTPCPKHWTIGALSNRGHSSTGQDGKCEP